MTFANVNLDEDEDMAPAEEDEDEDEDEEGDSGEFIDLLDVLDGKATTDDDEKLPKSKGPEDEAEVSDEEEREEDNQNAFAASDDEDLPEASDEFQKFIAGLDTTAKKRKADETDGEFAKVILSRKKRLITERTEAGAEDEFRAHTSGLYSLLFLVTGNCTHIFYY